MRSVQKATLKYSVEEQDQFPMLSASTSPKRQVMSYDSVNADE